MDAPDGKMSKVSQHNDQMGRLWPLAPEDGAHTTIAAGTSLVGRLRYQPMIGASAWNSLEAAKLTVGLFTPLVVLVLGVIVNRATRRLEQVQWANRQLIERRLNLYDAMAPRLNDLFCFFVLVGDFRNIEPPAAIAAKRYLDKTFHVNRFLFSARFSDKYLQFMAVCFHTFVGIGEPAKLRSKIELQKSERKGAAWPAEWDDLFVFPERHASSRQEVQDAYEQLMNCFAEELGVRTNGVHGRFF